mgnify:CR=1 FL=1
MKCLEIARLKDFAPNTPGLLGVAQGPQTQCREVGDSRSMRVDEPPSGNSCLRACGPLPVGSYDTNAMVISVWNRDQEKLF